MRKMANLLLVLLPANGVFSLAAAFQYELAGGLFFLVGTVVSLVTIFLSFLFLPVLAFNRNLPKLVFLPQIFLLFWSASGLWPLSAALGQSLAFTSTAVLQILLGSLAFLSINRRNRRSLLLTPDMFSSPGFSIANFLWTVGGGLVTVPACLVLFGFSLTGSYVEQVSGGFVRLGIDGLYMTERTYGRGDQTVRLTSMIHIGERDYYDQLVASVTGGETLILAEGVSDEDGLLQQAFSYRGVAELLGLTSQEKMQFEARMIDAAQLESPDFSGSAGNSPDIARADIDLREFDPLTLEFINAMGRSLGESRSLAGGFKAFNLWAQEHMTPEAKEIIMADLVDKRNRSVIGYLDSALQKYDHIMIPWGALHMTGIEEAIIKRGFFLRKDSERLSIDFKSLPYAVMLGQLIAPEAGR